MRRTVLRQLAAFPLALGSASALAKSERKIDKRLIGTWRSDKERTAKLWRYKNELDEVNKAKFESIFGKMTRRFTATMIYSEFEDQKSSGKYWVVASDSRSVVVAYPDPSGLELQQIFFEEDWHYVYSGYNIEFFRRVGN